LIFFYGGGSLLISHEKYIKDGKVLAHLGCQSKVFSGPLTEIFIETSLHKKNQISKLIFDILLWA
jgi:hypothetical protein